MRNKDIATLSEVVLSSYWEEDTLGKEYCAYCFCDLDFNADKDKYEKNCPVKIAHKFYKKLNKKLNNIDNALGYHNKFKLDMMRNEEPNEFFE